MTLPNPPSRTLRQRAVDWANGHKWVGRLVMAIGVLLLVVLMVNNASLFTDLLDKVAEAWQWVIQIYRDITAPLGRQIQDLLPLTIIAIILIVVGSWIKADHTP